MAFSADRVIEAFRSAAEENLLETARSHQVVELPRDGEMWITGDMHDHRRNFEKIARVSDLGANTNRHLILHELIHGDHFDADGAEGSWQMLFQAAELKCDFPDQVHFLLANHDLAQVHGEGIMKSGLSVCEAFTAGVKRDFGQRYHAVVAALTDFLLSAPLAVRTESGLFVCHSLPGDDRLESFDFTIFNRELNGNDYQRRVGPVYHLIWGRSFSPESAATFADRVNARIVITGHQPQETGFAVNGDRHLILASDHNQGVFLHVDLTEEYTINDLAKRLRKFAAVEI